MTKKEGSKRCSAISVIDAEEGTKAKGSGQTLETGKGEETDFPKNFLKEIQL